MTTSMTSISTTITSTVDARPPVLVTRPELVAQVLAGTVSVITAPSGYGKSTLAAQVAVAAELATLAVVVGEAAGPAELAAQIAHAATTVGLNDVTAALGHPDVDDAAAAALACLARRADPVLLVLDEIQRLDTAGWSWLDGLLAGLDDRHRVVLCGRRAATTVPAHRVDATQLTLTRDEVAVLADGTPAALGVVDELLAATGGWPAAVALAIHLLRRDPFVRLDGLRRSGAVVAQLVAPLVADLTIEERRRIAALATLPKLDGAVATAVAGLGAMSLLVDSGVPIMPGDDGWWRMADPVRDVLRGEHRLPERAAMLAADAYLAAGDLASAAAVLRDAGCLDGLAVLLDGRSWHELGELGEAPLRVALNMIEHRAVDELPTLLLKAAWVAEGRDPVARRGWLARADVEVPAGDPLRPTVDAELARDAARRGDIDTADKLAALALAAARPDDLVARGRALLGAGMASTIRCTPASLVVAGEQLTEAIELFRTLGERGWEADALNRLGYAVSFQGGRLELAEEQLRGALALLPSANAERALLLTYCSEVFDATGQVDVAESAVREALAIGRRLGDLTVIGFAAWSAALVAAHRADAAATLSWIDEAERNGGRWIDEPNGVEFYLSASEMCCALGEQAPAWAYHDRAVALAERHGLTDALGPGTARLQATFGDAAQAIDVLDGLDDAAWAVQRERWLRRLLRALAAHRLGDDVAAAAALAQARREAELLGQPDLPSRQEPYVLGLLAGVDQRGTPSAAPPLRVTLLGGFAVSRSGEDVTPPDGHPATVVKLLALRGALHVDEVVDVLWPDADADRSRSRLRNLLNRIRSRSGDVVVRAGDSLRLAADVEVDARSFEDLVDAVGVAAAGERAGLARLAVAAYPGELLPADRYEDWAALARERLRRRFLALVDLLADDAERRGELDEAVRQLDVAIAVEPLDESRSVRAARILLSQGRRATARQLVHHAIAVLDELGLPPSPDLTALLEDLA